MRPMRNDSGTLDAYAWPGGYPLVYTTRDNATICPACANRPDYSLEAESPDAFTNNQVDDWHTLVSVDIHWEGEPETCEECNCQIASAYGPVEEASPS
jgi:hypothetical protein